MGIASNNPVSVRAIGFTTIAPDASSKNISRKVFISYSRSKWTKFLLCFQRHCIGRTG
jgi:hypothetical protein